MTTMEQHVAAWNATKEYPGEFTHNGVRWALNIHAVDAADAERKAQSVRDSFRIVGGPIEAVIPWEPGQRP